MKKVLAVVMALVFALALVACEKSSLGVDTDDTGVHAVATGSAEGSGTGSITIEEGYGLCVNHIVNKGTFHVTATNAAGEVVFDKDLIDNIFDSAEVEPGVYDIVISAKGADGTVDVIPYDLEAAAMADASLDEALEEATGKTAEELGVSSSSSSK